MQWRFSRDHPNVDYFVDLFGDNSAVIGWLNGSWQCKSRGFQKLVSKAQNHLHDLYYSGKGLPAEKGGDWFRHTLREGNSQADALCNEVMETKGTIARSTRIDPDEIRYPLLVHGSFDGGKKGAKSAAAFCIHVLVGKGDETPRFIPLIEYAQFAVNASVASMELLGATMLAQQISQFRLANNASELIRSAIDAYPGQIFSWLDQAVAEDTRPRRVRRRLCTGRAVDIEYCS